MPELSSSESTTTMPAVPGVATCSVRDPGQENACGGRALWSYTWDWGETGFCCTRHQVILQQKARQLRRGVQFVALTPGAAPEVSRDERVRLKAEVLAAEEELVQAKSRTQQLFEQNTTLTAELRRLSLRDEAAQGQLLDLQSRIEGLESQKDALLAKLASSTDELQRVKQLMSAAGVDDSRAVP